MFAPLSVLLRWVVLVCSGPFVLGNEGEQSETKIPEQINDSKVGVKLLHVISPFLVEDCPAQFCPYDQAQSVTIGSMLRAKSRLGRGSVTLAAAAFQDDLEHLQLDGFETLPPLLRSTTTQYPDLPMRPSFPFVQDIFDNALLYDAKADYLIYTNSDIILHENFYDLVQQMISDNGYDYFTINRRLVSKTRIDGTLRSTSDLDEIFTSVYAEHPGSDCFVIKRELAEKINLGDVFIGAPFFANVLNLKALYHSRNPAVFKSDELMATFHLGDDRRWQNRRMGMFAFQNAMNSVCHDSWLQEVCASSYTGEHIRGVHIHCNRLASKMSRFVDDQFDFNDSNNFCRRQKVGQNAPNRAKFIFSMGIEGSGHHFLATVESQSDHALLARSHESFNALREKQKHAAHILREIYHLNDLHNDSDNLDLDAIYKEFVETLKEIQEIVQEKIDANRTVDGVFPIPLNAIDGIMTSFPGTGSVARYSQLPDLGIFYRACEDAVVDCGHILMTRDAHEVIRSTTRNRSFDHPKAQIINLAMQLNMMISQALQYPDKLLGCFDYNNPVTLVQNRLYGGSHDGKFESAILQLFTPSASLTLSERLDLVPEGFGLYMESMIRATNMLRKTCQTQLRDQPPVDLFNPIMPAVATKNVNKNLSPPFKIVQIGEPRTGSTFQYELLRAIIALKSPRGTKIESKFVSKRTWSSDPFTGAMGLASNSTFIMKTHTSDPLLRKASYDGSVAVFSSSEIVPYSIYTQKRANIDRCSECEVKKYKSIFQLTDDDIRVLQQHMRDFKILRQW